jgi:hypothetical protein
LLTIFSSKTKTQSAAERIQKAKKHRISNYPGYTLKNLDPRPFKTDWLEHGRIQLLARAQKPGAWKAYMVQPERTAAWGL